MTDIVLTLVEKIGLKDLVNYYYLECHFQLIPNHVRVVACVSPCRVARLGRCITLLSLNATNIILNATRRTGTSNFAVAFPKMISLA